MRSAFAMLLALSVLTTGCAHHQLRYNSVKQAKTVSDIHTQQVLDNLAKFAHNRHALPHFSYPNSGAASVTDNASANAGFAFLPSALDNWNFGLSGSRSNNEAYTVTPINDPEKLTLMRCAYQRAISGCCCFGESGACPDCEKRFNAFYLGSTDPDKIGAVTGEGDAIYRVNPGVEVVYFPRGENTEYEVLPLNRDIVHVVTAKRDSANRIGYHYLQTEYSGSASGPSTVAQPGVSVFKLATYHFRSLKEIQDVIKQVEDKELDPDDLRIDAGGAAYKASTVLDELNVAHEKNLKLGRDPTLSPVDESTTILQMRDELQQALNALVVEEFRKSPPDRQQTSADIRVVEYRNKVYWIDIDKPEHEELKQAIQAAGINGATSIITDYLGEASEAKKKELRVALRLPVPLDASSELERRYIENTLAEQTRRKGTVTPACLDGECWFCVGSRRDVPLDCPCNYVGSHCGTYVWVPPCGRDKLTQLTLTVLDIATGSAAAGPTTEVFAFIDKDGKTASDHSKASYIARADLPRGGSFGVLLPNAAKNAQPRGGDEALAIKRIRDEARLTLKRTLVQDAGFADLFDLLRRVEQPEDSEVSFITDDYKKAKLSVDDNDLLVVLAAQVLNEGDEPKEGEEKPGLLRALPAFPNEGTDSAQEANAEKVRAEIQTAARALLNAEYRMQELPTETLIQPAEAAAPDYRRPGAGFRAVGPLEASQTLQFLGTLQ